MKRNSMILILAFLSLVALAVPASAQVGWMSPLDKPGVSFEVSKTDFGYKTDLSFWAMEYTLAARVKLTKGLSALFEVPYSHISYKDNYYYDYYYISQSSVGNPFLGLEISGGASSYLLQAGVRLPLAEMKNERALLYGVYSAYDRWEAYYPEMTTLSLLVGGRISSPGEYRFQALIGPVIMAPDKGDSELFGDWRLEFWQEWPFLRLGVGYHVRYLFTEEGYDFDQRMTHQFGLSAAAVIGAFRPGIHLRLPLDETIRSSINMNYGLDLTVDLPQ